MNSIQEGVSVNLSAHCVCMVREKQNKTTAKPLDSKEKYRLPPAFEEVTLSGGTRTPRM